MDVIKISERSLKETFLKVERFLNICLLLISYPIITDLMINSTLSDISILHPNRTILTEFSPFYIEFHSFKANYLLHFINLFSFILYFFFLKLTEVVKQKPSP